MRPADLFGLTPEALIAPAPLDDIGGTHRRWALLLGDFESNKPNKTRVHPLLLALSRRQQDRLLWSFDAAHLTTVLHVCAVAGAVDHRRPQLCSLRHGGASHCALARNRSVVSIKKRGRWRSDASVRRYEKAALAQHEIHRVTEPAVTYGRRVHSRLQQYMLGLLPPPVPPRANVFARGAGTDGRAQARARSQ